MFNQLEKTIATFGGPAMAGIKPGNLVSFSKETYPFFQSMIRRYNQLLNSSGIYFRVYDYWENHYLLLIYRKMKLSAWVFQQEYQKILLDHGYPVTQEVDLLLDHLGDRLKNHQEEFPHEIGVFLGYPLEDIMGFKQNEGKNYILCGYWKVYGNCLEAQRLFRSYDKCRNAICKRIAQGRSITQLFKTAYTEMPEHERLNASTIS